MSQAIALLENDQTFVSSLSDGLKDEGYRVGTYAGAEKRSAERRDQERHHYPLRTANELINQHGNDAPIHAAMRAN